MTEIQTDPFRVLAALARSASVRKSRTGEAGLQLWSSVVWGPSEGSKLDNKLITARLVRNLCNEIERNREDLELDISGLWDSEITKIDSEASLFSTIEKLQPVAETKGQIIAVADKEVSAIVGKTKEILEELRKVSDKNQISVYVEIENYLVTEVLPLLNRSLELGLWLMRPEMLSNIGANMLTFGMRLSASGDFALAERICLIALSTASLVAGLVDPQLGLSLGAGSVLFTASAPSEMLQKLQFSPKETH